MCVKYPFLDKLVSGMSVYGIPPARSCANTLHLMGGMMPSECLFTKKNSVWFQDCHYITQDTVHVCFLSYSDIFQRKKMRKRIKSPFFFREMCSIQGLGGSRISSHVQTFTDGPMKAHVHGVNIRAPFLCNLTQT